MKGLVLTYLLTAVGAVGAFKRPVIGLYVYVAFAVLRPQFLFSWAGNMDSLSLAVGVAVIAAWMMHGAGSWDLGRAKPVVWALLLFTAAYTLSALASNHPDAAFKALLELVKIVVPFCVGVTMMREERDWKPLLWIAVLSIGYVGFDINMTYLSGMNTAATGFGGMDNNCFGVELVTLFGLAVGLLLASKRWWERALSGGIAAILLHTTLLTFSRGAMFGLLAVGLTAFVVLPKRPSYFVIIVVVALVAVRFTGPELLTRYASSFASGDQRDGSAQSRLDLWTDTLQVVAARPLLGVGPSNWPFEAASFGWPEGKSAHSVWMETLAEVGVPGTLALLLFFVVAAAKLWPLARARVTDENHYRVAIAMGVILAVAGFVTSGMFVSVVGLEAPYYVVMLGAALLRGPVPATAAAAVRASASTSHQPSAAMPRTVAPPDGRTPRPLSPAVPRLLPKLEPRRHA